MPSTEIPRARQLMTTHVHAVAPEMPLAEVVAFLLKHEISNAPVIETGAGGQRHLLGFLSESDCLQALSNEMFFGNPAQPRTAAAIMKRHPVCVSPDTDVFALASMFASHGFRHLPVVEGEQFVGIVSRRDILAALDACYRDNLREGEDRRQLSEPPALTNYRFVARSV